MPNFDPVTGRIIRRDVLKSIGQLQKTRPAKVGRDADGNKLTELIHTETGETNGYLTTKNDTQDGHVFVDAPALSRDELPLPPTVKGS